MLDWEKTTVDRLSPEEIEDGLAGPELGDAADWIFKIVMRIIEAVRRERASCEWEFSPVAAALSPGGERERKIAHAFTHLADVALAYGPGAVPYTSRVLAMRRALSSARSELADYWRAPSAFDAAQAVSSFLYEIFQRRYVPADAAKWREDVMCWRDRSVAAIMALASDYAGHYDERLAKRRNGGRPRCGERAAFSQAGVAVLCGRCADTVARWENGQVRPPPGYSRRLRELGGVSFFDFVREYNAHHGVNDVFTRIRKGEVVYTEGLTERERGLVEEYVVRLRRGD